MYELIYGFIPYTRLFFLFARRYDFCGTFANGVRDFIFVATNILFTLQIFKVTRYSRLSALLNRTLSISISIYTLFTSLSPNHLFCFLFLGLCFFIAESLICFLFLCLCFFAAMLSFSKHFP